MRSGITIIQMQRGFLDQAVSPFGSRLSTTVVTSTYEAGVRTVVNRGPFREYADDTLLDYAKHNHHPCRAMNMH